MGERGPESGYKPEHCELARQVARLGATNEELADILGVCRATLQNWIRDHPEFREAIDQGKLVGDAKVADRLYQRAIGYERPAIRFFANKEGPPTEVKYTYHHPPDTTAAIFWLRNRRRADWREQVEHRHTTSAELVMVLEAARLRARPATADAKPPPMVEATLVVEPPAEAAAEPEAKAEAKLEGSADGDAG